MGCAASGKETVAPLDAKLEQGTFEWEESCELTEEARRDFARFFLASDRSVFVATQRGGIRPVLLPPSHKKGVGDLSAEVINVAENLFCETLETLLNDEPLEVEDAVALAWSRCLSVSRCGALDFIIDKGLHFSVLQPRYVLVLRERERCPHATLVAYGFVAQSQKDIVGGPKPQDKHTRLIARFVSELPDVDPASPSKRGRMTEKKRPRKLLYLVRRTKEKSSEAVMKMDADYIRDLQPS